MEDSTSVLYTPFETQPHGTIKKGAHTLFVPRRLRAKVPPPDGHGAGMFAHFFLKKKLAPHKDVVKNSEICKRKKQQQGYMVGQA